jgi:serine/threonine-protein kinase HipA
MSCGLKLSSAFDLTPSPAVGQDRRDLAMECGELGRFANARNLLSQHVRFIPAKDEPERVLVDMVTQVRDWYDTIRACGVLANDAEAVRGAFLYPGFSS